jgi:CRISPR-associated exonuclease Cas4
MDKTIYTTGTEVNYYFVCHRKLWLFSHNIQMEHESEAVQIGRLVHEHSYTREPKKEIQLDNIKLDFFDLREGVIHEVKKSKSVEEAHRWQLLYYLYYLKQNGVEGLTGEIDYPLLKRKETVELTSENESHMIEIMNHIHAITDSEIIPERINKPFCKTCSYYELCWS